MGGTAALDDQKAQKEWPLANCLGKSKLFGKEPQLSRAFEHATGSPASALQSDYVKYGGELKESGLHFSSKSECILH